MRYYCLEYSCEPFIPLFTELKLQETEHPSRITELEKPGLSDSQSCVPNNLAMILTQDNSPTGIPQKHIVPDSETGSSYKLGLGALSDHFGGARVGSVDAGIY